MYLTDVNQKLLNKQTNNFRNTLLTASVEAINFLSALWRIVLQNHFLLPFTVVNERFVKVYDL